MFPRLLNEAIQALRSIETCAEVCVCVLSFSLFIQTSISDLRCSSAHPGWVFTRFQRLLRTTRAAQRAIQTFRDRFACLCSPCLFTFLSCADCLFRLFVCLFVTLSCCAGCCLSTLLYRVLPFALCRPFVCRTFLMRPTHTNTTAVSCRRGRRFDSRIPRAAHALRCYARGCCAGRFRWHYAGPAAADIYGTGHGARVGQADAAVGTHLGRGGSVHACDQVRMLFVVSVCWFFCLRLCAIAERLPLAVRSTSSLPVPSHTPRSPKRLHTHSSDRAFCAYGDGAARHTEGGHDAGQSHRDAAWHWRRAVRFSSLILRRHCRMCFDTRDTTPRLHGRR